MIELLEKDSYLHNKRVLKIFFTCHLFVQVFDQEYLLSLHLLCFRRVIIKGFA